MVKPKRDRRIAAKPTTPPPAADNWVSSGGLDPEIQPAPAPELETKGKPYPHRISFDTTKEQYKRLKKACFEEERSLNDAIREAVEDWLKTRNQ
jgi:hypothetical protein